MEDEKIIQGSVKVSLVGGKEYYSGNKWGLPGIGMLDSINIC